jgi:ribosome recycling factor
LSPEVKKEVAKSAKNVSENPKIAISEMQRLLKFIKENNVHVKLQEIQQRVLGYCNCEPNF